MDMTLHNIGRTELVRQLRAVRDGLEHADTRVIVPRPNGTVDMVVKVKEDADGVFLHALDTKDRHLLDFGAFFGSSLHEMKLDELIDALEACTHEDVWVGWNSPDPSTVVGKVFGMAHDGLLTAVLAPVPKDIERVNEAVMRECAKECPRARDGLQCGACEDLTTCYTIVRVGEAYAASHDVDLYDTKC